MFLARSEELMGGPLFALRMRLRVAAGTNAGVFHAAVFRGASAWDVDVPPPWQARAAAALSLAIWVSVIVCGRVLAKA